MYLVSVLQRLVLVLAAVAVLASLNPAQAATVRATRTVHRQTHRTTVVVRHRPFSHSVAIVGGSALAGAGVGALVGGPVGAIAGAMTGGMGGLIYDRKTHKKRIVVRR